MGLSLPVAGCSVTILYVVWRLLLRRIVFPSPLDNLPGPPSPSFLKGNLLQAATRQSWDYRRRHAETYGPFSVLHGPIGTKILVVHDPKALHSIIVKEETSFRRRVSPSDLMHLLLGPGLLTAEGVQHRRQRKLINPAFSAVHLRQMTGLFYEVSHKVRTAIEARIGNESQIIDVHGWISRTTLELLGQAGLGYSFDSFAEESSDTYGNALKTVFPTISQLPWMSGLVAGLSYFVSADQMRALLGLIPFEGSRRLMDVSKIMERRSKEIIAEKKVALAKADRAGVREDAGGKDVMSILLKYNMAASDTDKLTDEEIVAQTSVLILGGMDTTSNLITRMFQLLAQHPTVQEKLRAELVEGHNGEATLDYEALNKLPYLEAVCRETLRLYPPGQVIPRRAVKDILLPLSAPIRGKDGTLIHNVLVPRGTYVMVNIQASNENKAFWGEDAYEWKPERWLEPLPRALDEARIPSVYSTILSFFGGPRACIGFKFAQLEMKVILSVLLMGFSFELTDEEIVWNVGPVSFPTMGLDSIESELLLRMKRL
ncbi:hypothetical protein V8D89_004296 [Ganoderma adspersum]